MSWYRNWQQAQARIDIMVRERQCLIKTITDLREEVRQLGAAVERRQSLLEDTRKYAMQLETQLDILEADDGK